jgi:DNA-binding MarR family transcriptional regulator
MPQPRWLNDAEMRAWRGTLRMTWLLEAAISRDLARDSHLSHADYYVLVQLSESPERRMRMSDLAAGILWSKSRLSHQIDRMEARGLVRRQDCPSDARGTFAVLTPTGMRAIRAAAPHHVESIRRNFLGHLTPGQIAVLGDVTEVVVNALAESLRPAAPAVDVLIHHR